MDTVIKKGTKVRCIHPCQGFTVGRVYTLRQDAETNWMSVEADDDDELNGDSRYCFEVVKDEHPQEDAFRWPEFEDHTWINGYVPYAAPIRVEILNEASSLTHGARDEEYGPPQRNMGCAGELKAVFRSYATRAISPAEQEALDMVITKLSRLACGAPKRDTYTDMAAYAAIAGECALEERYF